MGYIQSFTNPYQVHRLSCELSKYYLLHMTNKGSFVDVFLLYDPVYGLYDNVMAVKAPAPCFARASATMGSNMLEKHE